MSAFADRYFQSKDGLRLHARDYAGSSDPARLPVICIHGLSRNAADFEDLAPHLTATGRRVLALDVRGRGGSAWDLQPQNYHPGTYAEDVVTLAAQAGIARAVFIGTSMGGIITMVLSAVQPDLIAAAVLNDIGPELSPIGLARIAGYVGNAKPVTTWAEAATYAKATNGAAFPLYNDADWDRFARRLFTQANGTLATAYDPAIALAFKPAEGAAPAPAPDMTPLFRALTTGRPSLLIRGGLSDLIDQPIADRMRALAPTMAYAEVPHVGHAPMLTEPEALSAILTLLASVD
jgi:pimeloyl-ACP methyl ester carboxylesterase